LDLPLIKETQEEWCVVNADPLPGVPEVPKVHKVPKAPEVPEDYVDDEESDLDGDLFYASYMQGSGLAGAAPPGGEPPDNDMDDDPDGLYNYPDEE
jgi:hypothetical protein